MLEQATTEYFLALIAINFGIALAGIGVALLARWIGPDGRAEVAEPGFMGYAFLQLGGILAFLCSLLMSFAAEPSRKMPESFGIPLAEAKVALAVMTVIGFAAVMAAAFGPLKRLFTGKSDVLLSGIGAAFAVCLGIFTLLQLALATVSVEIYFAATYLQGGMMALIGNALTLILLLAMQKKIKAGFAAEKPSSGKLTVIFAMVSAPAILLSLGGAVQMYL